MRQPKGDDAIPRWGNAKQRHIHPGRAGQPGIGVGIVQRPVLHPPGGKPLAQFRREEDGLDRELRRKGAEIAPQHARDPHPDQR